ncbi:MAG: putative DNA-binding domain-containing protein [Luteimonas sp.]
MNAVPADATLAALQRQFMARLRGLPDGDLARAVDAGRVSREVGLRIYSHAYGARLREALEHDHGVLATYLGDALWESLCSGYIAAHPSRHRSLRDFGDDLPGYLLTSPPFCEHPEIAELAQFERQLLDGFDAAADPPAQWAQLLALPPAHWPALQLRFHPSVRLHHARCNSVEIWRAIKAGDAPSAAAVAVTQDWLLWRDVARVGRFRSLDGDEAAAIAYCHHGGNFAGLCELLAIKHEAAAVPARALAYLQAWCGEGWIARWI